MVVVSLNVLLTGFSPAFEIVTGGIEYAGTQSLPLPDVAPVTPVWVSLKKALGKAGQ